jgi:hypothetical protein
MNKKIISILMAFILTFSMCVTPFAAEKTFDVVMINDTTCEITLDDGSVMIARDLPNGDAEFIIKKAGRVTASSYAHRARSTIENTTFDKSNVPQITFEEVKAPKTSIISSKGYTNAGKIYYQYMIGANLINCNASAAYERTISSQENYDAYGTYNNLAQLAGFIALVYACPAIIAGKVAQWLLFALNIGVYVNFFIPKNTKVSAVKTHNKWKVTNGGDTSHYNTFEGDKFEFTFNESKKVDTVLDFYPVTAISKKDKAFGIIVFSSLWYSSAFHVQSWAPV